ncbi:MAG: hypothetical protein AMJ88_01490 [Anaerolineae bacterium SM23_ 63]|nr:MAG: hypothetical protein AMJ88_01490 [Anaerolineae bacterium SM23_ 63]
MTMNRFILVSLAIVGICLLLVYLLIKRRKTIFAVLMGLITIGAYQVYLHRSLALSIRACIERACTSIGLPHDCLEAEFGCTEWSGISVFIFILTGIVQVIIFTVGTGIMAFLGARKKGDATHPSEAPPFLGRHSV